MSMRRSKDDGIRRKAYIYTRVSTKEQVDGASLEVQEKVCRRFAEYDLNADVMRVYREEGESAKTSRRPQLIKMMADAQREKGDIDYVVFYAPDRVSRAQADFQGIIKYQLNKCGVKLRYATQPSINDTPEGHFTETIQIASAQLENELKAERVSDAMRERARQGYWITQPPLGFKIKIVMPDGTLADSLGRKERVKYPKVLVPDDTILPGSNETIVRAITDLLNTFANTDISETELHKMALAKGLKSSKGSPLPFNSLHNILQHPVYCGYSKPGNALQESIKLKFDGLISKETFDRIQVKLTTGKRELKPRSDSLYPLDGTILCNHCNKPLHGDAPRDGSDNHNPRYYCRGGIKRGHRYESAKASEIHALYADFLQHITPTEGAVRLFKTILKRTAMAKLSNANVELRQINKDEQKLTEREERALNLLLDGEISVDEKDTIMRNIGEERFSLQQKRAELEEQKNLNESTIEYVCNFITMPAKLWRDADLETKRALQSFSSRMACTSTSKPKSVERKI